VPSLAKHGIDGLGDRQRGALTRAGIEWAHASLRCRSRFSSVHEASGTVALGRVSMPRRSNRPFFGRPGGDPDLENPRRRCFQIVLCVPDTGCPRLITTWTFSGLPFGGRRWRDCLLCVNRAFADVGRISMFAWGWARKARVFWWRSRVVPYAQRCPSSSRGIRLVGKGEVVRGLHPPDLPPASFVEWSTFDHRHSPGSTVSTPSNRGQPATRN